MSPGPAKQAHGMEAGLPNPCNKDFDRAEDSISVRTRTISLLNSTE